MFTLIAGSITVTVAVLVAEVSSNTVGITAGLNVFVFVRSDETFAAFTAVWPTTTLAPPLRCVARTCAL